jgi:hypothetical protein
VGVILALAIWYLTFRENAYLYPVVKLEREQRVVTTGPYRYVRHPVYAACLILFPAIALLLGSWFGLLLSLCFIGYLSFELLWKIGCFDTNTQATPSTHERYRTGSYLVSGDFPPALQGTLYPILQLSIRATARLCCS